jgi:hypothetical protein
MALTLNIRELRYKYFLSRKGDLELRAGCKEEFRLGRRNFSRRE